MNAKSQKEHDLHMLRGYTELYSDTKKRVRLCNKMNYQAGKSQAMKDVHRHRKDLAVYVARVEMHLGVTA